MITKDDYITALENALSLAIQYIQKANDNSDVLDSCAIPGTLIVKRFETLLTIEHEK